MLMQLGGIKVTRLIVLILATVVCFGGRNGSKLWAALHASQGSVRGTLAVLSLFPVLTSIFIIARTWWGDFVDLLFEVSSALALSACRARRQKGLICWAD